MFTGIITDIGIVRERRDGPDGATFVVEAPATAKHLAPGDSVSIDGACHTVEAVEGDAFRVTSVPVTLARTTLGERREGARVNLERAATADTALGGHLVQGHVDGTARVIAFDAAAADGDRRLVLEVPGEIDAYVVPRGSIAVDGISLTVAGHEPGRVEIAIVPFTLEHTTIGDRHPGDRVNVEADIMGKYVLQYLQRIGVADAGKRRPTS